MASPAPLNGALKPNVPPTDRGLEAAAKEPLVQQGSQSLVEYARATWTRVLAGQSGVLPVVGGAILISIIFQSQNSQFLSPGNLVNLLVQGSVFMLIGMGEVFTLLLGETDLSLGFVGGIAGTITTILVQPDVGWPWWAAIPTALAATAALGHISGNPGRKASATLLRGHPGRAAGL